LDDTKSRYATAKIFFSNGLPTEIKIPKLKNGKDEQDVINFLYSLYQNVDRIDVKITYRA